MDRAKGRVARRPPPPPLQGTLRVNYPSHCLAQPVTETIDWSTGPSSTVSRHHDTRTTLPCSRCLTRAAVCTSPAAVSTGGMAICSAFRFHSGTQALLMNGG